MEPQWERARGASAQRVWAEVLCPVAAELANSAHGLSDEAIGYIAEQIPELVPDPELAEENRASTEASIRAFAALVGQGADPREIELPAATIAYAQASVRRGMSLAALMRSYRLGVEVVWRWLFAELAARVDDASVLAEASELCSAWVFAYADGAMTLAEQLYDVERARWMRSTAASQAETIEAILAGRPRDPAQASSRLRYELDRQHVAAVAWVDSSIDEAAALTYMEAAVAEVARAAGAEGLLLHPLGLLAVAAWMGRAAPFDASALDDLRLDHSASPGVHVALGEPGAGVAGFRLSHVEAGHARRVASLARRRAGSVTRYSRVALSALASVDTEQARVFVARELGALAADDDVSLRLAATLRAFLDENASRSRAAKRLSIHENTVSYRVRQAEEILGRSVDERALELRVALSLVNVLREPL
jgi:DNA-binding PucR family transcriptional regulator